MARNRTTTGGFSVSGPGIDKAGYPSGDTGLSAAINFAQADSVPEGASVYVRNPGGDVYGSVERTDDGCLVRRGSS